MVSEYIPRVVDSLVESRLKRPMAVVIKGPKYCGKTRTAEMCCRSALYLADHETKSYVEVAAQTGSRSYLDGEYPRLIDEWQVVPSIWDHVKFAVDHNPDSRFVLTGSSTPVEDVMLHPGTGRFSEIRMRTMSLFESGESNGAVSLRGLFDGASVDARTELNYDDIVRIASRGGWPMSVAIDDEPGVLAEDYLRSTVEHDMPRMFGIDPEHSETKRLRTVRTVTSRMISSIARNSGKSTPVSTIIKDVNAQGEIVTGPTFTTYVENLERMFFTDNLEAWNPHMRSRTRLKSKSKWYLTDPSLAVAGMGAPYGVLAKDTETMGFVFETLCLRDIRVYAQLLGGQVYYIADDRGYEVNFIIQLRDGRWGAFEVKLGSKEFDKGAGDLIRLREKVDTSVMGEPSFLAILTGAQYGYVRPDGVRIVPIGCLGP